MNRPGTSGPPETCPVCGAEVPPRASACPQCGADDRTGWSEAAESDGLDLPDTSFDYSEFVQREFGPGPARPRRHAVWWMTAWLLLFLFLGWMVTRFL